MSVEVVFETHSISENNENGIATGWLPGRLSARGRALAVELGARRRDDNLAVVFTSDLTRAVETAEIAFADADIPIVRDSRLRECNYGELNGAPTAELVRERLSRVDAPFPGGESWRGAVARVGEFLDELANTRDRERVILIGHTATRWALEHRVHGAPLEELVSAPFDWRPGWEFRLPSRGE